jgi:transcription initiation factor TFIID subunit 1, fungi type
VETWYPRRRDVPRNFLDSVVGDTQRQRENKAVADVVAASNVEDDLSKTLSVCNFLQNGRRLRVFTSFQDFNIAPSSNAMNDRSFDLVVLSNWEDQILFGSSGKPSAPVPSATQNGLTQPVNKALESGTWAQSIIWDKTAPFRDFTRIEFNHEDDIVPEARPLADGMRPRKRLKADALKTLDKFNLSNDAHYELSAKEGARQRVRQTFGQISVEHAYPAQKLQLPFVRRFLC